MQKFGKSQSTRRVEDLRFLTGGGRYVDDIAPSGALHAWFFRSPVAHAEIDALDLTDAREMPGVHAVMGAADMAAMGVDLAMPFHVVKNADGSDAAAPVRPFLARGRVRFVGEPVAVVVAETLDQARDAGEAIGFDYSDLPVHMDVAPGGTPVHDAAPDNVVFDWQAGDRAATEAAFAKAARIVVLEMEDNRVIVNPMEPRGAWAEWDGARLHLCVNGQGVWSFKDDLMAAFDLPAEAVRVTNPDVGGGFGLKASLHPEYLAVAAAAKALGRPVRWMSERTEAMLSDCAGRDLTNVASLAFDADHRIVGYKCESLCNIGAYVSQYGQGVQTECFAKVLMGTYDVQAAWMRCRGVFTNTAQTDAYRGAGRPEAIFALERAMDQAARELGVDPWELRRRNFIAVDKFPYTSATGETYDVGDFARVLARAEGLSDHGSFAQRRAGSEAAGKLRGQGLCYYIESILGSATEGVKVELHADGTASIYVGTQSNGQGHETVYAKFLSDQTGIPADLITVVQGDSDLIAEGGGTGGSRSVTVQNNATLATASEMIARFGAFLAEDLGVNAGDIDFDDERFRVQGSNETPTMLDVAERAHAAGRTDLLTFQGRSTLPGRSYPNGAHVAEVEVDPDTGVVEVVKYSVVDDFGNLINPMLAEGQVHGGVAQGIGQAIFERVAYDAEGQLLTATFMDYGMPRADNVPYMAFATEAVPSTANALGMKGCGEAGTVGALAAVSNAVLDALWDRGVRKIDMPFTPQRVWAALNDAAEPLPVAAE